ncbi:glycosyltransferase family 4 protein [Prosthecobacter vanneervenii]|uniref:Glycosyltransferase involved in cell wall biosynthesis n=1 Tax=Prosthecobacter vanneervenii TaxID=48466 RepID=A0A7W8DJM0_9BACT|nr:glycosyltransferase family 1 protein [Prosthecobacter vanneervenii]MBB5032222.1 glycosyltransferase involved in cell wall biosynthesis [Prosthecobacter vanneervenii]
MKIAISTSVIQRGKTGVAQYVLALTRALMPYTDVVKFHILALAQDLPLFDFARGRMEIIPVDERWRSPVRNIWWHQRVLPRWLDEQQIDVLHVPSYRRMVCSAHCNLISTIHDLAPFHVKKKYDLARMLYGRIVVKLLARRQNGIIAVSSSTARDVERFFGVPVQNQNVILNGIDHSRFNLGDPVAARTLVESRWQLMEPFFLYVSRIEHPAKNHIRLIESFNQFKTNTGSPWQLVLAGSDWHGAEHIHSAARQSPFSKDIRFLGFVEDAVLPDLYRAASVMVYPSLFEGFGLPPIEAMACGCPVICSNRGSLAEVVGSAARIINPEDQAQMADALQDVAIHHEKRESLIQAGLLNARRFNWDENAKRVMEVYEKPFTGSRSWGG